MEILMKKGYKCKKAQEQTKRYVEREAYCDIKYFMQHGCNACKMGAKCDEKENKKKVVTKWK